jgi:hypothetical protein
MGISSKSIGRKTAGSAVGKFTKSGNMGPTGGDILNYPYSFDQDAADPQAIALGNRLAKQQHEERYRIAEI